MNDELVKEFKNQTFNKSAFLLENQILQSRKRYTTASTC